MGSGCVTPAVYSRTLSTRLEAQRQVDKAGSKMRMKLGLAFTRWRALKRTVGMKSDAELACFLLGKYTPAFSLHSLPKYCFNFIRVAQSVCLTINRPLKGLYVGFLLNRLGDLCDH
uniref:Uncharacterized protein n=1 Tax=Sphaeramia orbicularis TaxID=375764 RepID=A0A673BLX5_9TELE